VIIDEAHWSQGGDAAARLKQSPGALAGPDRGVAEGAAELRRIGIVPVRRQFESPGDPQCSPG
jgi:hypothetical protein